MTTDKIEPVATVLRSGLERIGKATSFICWESGANKLSDGEHFLYSESTVNKLLERIATLESSLTFDIMSADRKELAGAKERIKTLKELLRLIDIETAKDTLDYESRIADLEASNQELLDALGHDDELGSLCDEQQSRIAHLEAIKEAFIEVCKALQFANDATDGGIDDTIWMMGRPETLFDFMDSVLEKE